MTRSRSSRATEPSRGRETYGYGYEDDRYDTPRRGDPPRSPRRPPGGGGPGQGQGPPGGGTGPFQFNVATMAVLAGVLVVGIGIGTALSSNTAGDQGNIASSQQLDLAVPDPEFCKQWGASAFVVDVEMYTTMNPSSSFVTQPKLQPGCVIRRENWSVLQKEGAVTNEQMRQCKQRMNTFAYIGSIKDKPVVRCVYQTDIVDNRFQSKGVAGAADDSVGITPEASQF
ncbi:DUF3172 domain-containing protein [Cyanobium sp. Morenito 9A2]|uniref:DUF3172 domain-containing protein n=1 Tax=Cyanobium sp. Morenito 9A2 TaxID=2823718 RepID=UPI0020CCE484|nr:DUF3172 domain-containing protein [Cyanobium sp. Morenito 9A2]MCP9849927.1 DUF3172 domain-containing protein [Cyanobium sp. Morenito 9A2]